MVLIIIFIAGAFFWFLFATGIQAIQEAVNPSLAEANWISSAAYGAFAFANNFLTYFWTFLFAIIVFVAAYWVYIYAQRRSAGY